MADDAGRLAADARAANAAARAAMKAVEDDPGNNRKVAAARVAVERAARLRARQKERENARGRKGSGRGSAAAREQAAVTEALVQFNGFWSGLLGKASKRAAGGSSGGGGSTTKSDGSSWWS